MFGIAPTVRFDMSNLSKWKSARLIVAGVVLLGACFYAYWKLRTPRLTLDLAVQPTVAELELTRDTSEDWYARSTRPLAVTLILNDGSRLNFTAADTYVSPVRDSDKVARVSFHLPNMTTEEVVQLVEQLADRLELSGSKSGRQQRIQDWRKHVNAPAGNFQRLVFNGRGGQPRRSIVVLRSYNQREPWFIELQLNWDAEYDVSFAPESGAESGSLEAEEKIHPGI